MRKERGITLIALIITIIVLLLLTFVTIDIVVDTFFFENSKKVVADAKEKLKDTNEKEENIINEWRENIGGKEKDAPMSSIAVTSSFISKTDTTITVEATATSSNPDENIVYEFWASTDLEGNFLIYGESEPVIQGTTVTITAENLESYTTYYWLIIANHGIGELSEVRTYCLGTGQTCTTSSCAGSTTASCPTTVTKTCNDGGKTCPTCNGTGSYNCTGIWGDVSWSYIGSASGASCDECLGTTSIRCSGCYQRVVLTGYCKNCDGGKSNTEGTTHGSVSCSKVTTCSHGETNSHTYSATCSTCKGTGTKTVSCAHKVSTAHKYCKHYNNTTLTSHEHCEHDRVEQHDD